MFGFLYKGFAVYKGIAIHFFVSEKVLFSRQRGKRQMNGFTGTDRLKEIFFNLKEVW